MAVLKCCLLAFIAIVCHLKIAAAAVTITNEPYTASIAENATVGHTVVTVAATTGTDGDTIVYSLDAQEPDTTPGIFAIGGSSGVITVGDTTHLDFETHIEYKLTIKAAVNGNNSVSATTTVTVSVTDVDGPPKFAKSTYAACVNKDSQAGTTVLQVTATDIDAGDTLKYAINGTTFEVTSDGEIKVAGGMTVDGTTTTYNLKLTATDDDSPPETGTATVIVTVGDPCSGGYAATLMAPFYVLLISAFIAVFNLL